MKSKDKVNVYLNFACFLPKFKKGMSRASFGRKTRRTVNFRTSLFWNKKRPIKCRL